MKKTSYRLATPSRLVRGLLLGCMTLWLTACATLSEVTALRDVDFSLRRVSGINLAGVDLSTMQTTQNFDMTQLARLGLAMARQDMPLKFDVWLEAANPASNNVQARLVRMDWTLFLHDKETIRGQVDKPVVLPPGQPQQVPVAVSLNLMEFFEGGMLDLAQLALDLATRDGVPENVRLEVVPTIDTPLGPMRYPKPIMVNPARL